jgi:hypothetical protein
MELFKRILIFSFSLRKAVALYKPGWNGALLPATAKVYIGNGASIPGLAALPGTGVNGQGFFHQENAAKEIYTMITIANLYFERAYNLQIFSGNDVVTPNCVNIGTPYTVTTKLISSENVAVSAFDQ